MGATRGVERGARCFLATLLLIVAATTRGARSVLKNLLLTATSFTAGHSATLALAVLGIVDPARGTIEFLIALSIVATAWEGFLAVRGNEAEKARLAIFALLGGIPLPATGDPLRSLATRLGDPDPISCSIRNSRNFVFPVPVAPIT